MVIRENESLNLSIPVACTIRNNEEIKRIVNSIVKKIKLAYAVNFDIKYDENGRAKLLEINPRLSASCILAIKAGVNLPLLVAYMALGKEIEIKKVKEGITAYFYSDVFFIE
ncbi:MAG: ATP-grasp domain-containing protein [Promethearchaeota archaeon]